jgi:hypothetical protein
VERGLIIKEENSTQKDNHLAKRSPGQKKKFCSQEIRKFVFT